jgi:hypothetical protein
MKFLWRVHVPLLLVFPKIDTSVKNSASKCSDCVISVWFYSSEAVGTNGSRATFDREFQ